MGKKQRYKHHRNEEAFRADIERRRSSAGSPHDPRPNRERTRLDKKRKEISDQLDNRQSE